MFLMCLIYSQVPSLLGHSPLYIRGALRVPLCCFSALCGHINDQQIVNFTSKGYCQDNQVIYRRHGRPILPFVNGLRCCESEDFLQVFDRHSCGFHHSGYIFPGCCHIDRSISFSPFHIKKPSAHQDKRFMRKRYLSCMTILKSLQFKCPDLKTHLCIMSETCMSTSQIIPRNYVRVIND